MESVASWRCSWQPVHEKSWNDAASLLWHDSHEIGPSSATRPSSCLPPCAIGKNGSCSLVLMPSVRLRFGAAGHAATTTTATRTSALRAARAISRASGGVIDQALHVLAGEARVGRQHDEVADADERGERAAVERG